MLTLNKKQVGVLISLILLIVSIVGMVIMKSEIEVNASQSNEVYFSIFRMLSITILVFFLADWFFKRWREFQLLKNEKVNAELINLKNQISPHFFFNTLNNLYGLIKKDSDKARDFVLKLSDLMRYSIYSSDLEAVLLTEEIRYLENFISLHEIRYHNSIDIRFDHQLLAKDVKVYPLLLIILVENAFKHGAEKLTENAFVYLDLKSSDQKLNFKIENNFDKSTLNLESGLGLNNLQKRLSLLYPGKHEFKTSIKDGIYKAELELLL